MKLKTKIRTSGKGLWSDKATSVRLIEITLHDPMFGYSELRVRFDRRTWNVARDGLIYTDDAFLRHLKGVLGRMGFPMRGVDYTDQGSQGQDYISLSVGPAFTKKFLQKEKH